MAKYMLQCITGGWCSENGRYPVANIPDCAVCQDAGLELFLADAVDFMSLDTCPVEKGE